jgi:hypothetical protein
MEEVVGSIPTRSTSFLAVRHRGSRALPFRSDAFAGEYPDNTLATPHPKVCFCEADMALGWQEPKQRSLSDQLVF